MIDEKRIALHGGVVTMSIRLMFIWLILVSMLVACSAGTPSDSAAETIESAQEHFNEGDLDSAIADLDRAIELAPDLAVAYQYRAYAYLQRGQVGRLTDYDETDDDTIYGSQADLDRAIDDLDRAIELDPDEPTAFLNRGTAYSFKGESDRAIIDCDRAIQLDPNYTEAYRRRGNAYLDKGDLDQAIVNYDRAIELDPDNPYTYNDRAFIYHLQGDFGHAIADFDRVIELTPDDGRAYKNRGVIYVEMGHEDKAVADFREVLRLSNDPLDRQYAEEQLALLGVIP